MRRNDADRRPSQVSHSIFVTNFPPGTSAKQLWDICEQYGKVVDTFIPNRLSKAGKKFAFVRFIKVSNIDVLVGNLNTIWIGKFRLRFNLARFQRESKGDGVTDNGQKKYERVNVPATSTFTRSFAAAVSNDSRPYTGGKQIEDKPLMVIDDDCLIDKSFELTLVAKVKKFESMTNLRVILNDEGFENVTIRYLGGFWVSLEFLDTHARVKFQEHTGVETWFSVIQPWSNEFRVEERVSWVDVEGIPSVAWTTKTFSKIANRWGELLFEEDPNDNNLWCKRLCVVTKSKDFIMETFKIIIKGESEDPFGIYNLLNKEDQIKEGEPVVFSFLVRLLLLLPQGFLCGGGFRSSGSLRTKIGLVGSKV
ncbi:hypothetical protein CTI12_AA176520 [Artemisia annua]|uniref:RRM domain-containing protein n=1 Tax=Artemisia annua TaxID=35608 RepID=A0A2U1PA55_ARTAN|nr:hypothetical protein CTI12_AA176520 [Artemisia annua]